MTYTKNHKIFLQTIIAKGITDDEEGKMLIIKLFDHNRILEIVNEINVQLMPLNMMIKAATCEVTGQTYWILINTIIQDTSRFQINFSKGQVALIRNVFSEIITSCNNCISSTACLNLCSSLDVKLMKTDAEDFLNDMVEQQWLFLKDGCYYMGVRSIAELIPYFKKTYTDTFNSCPLCKEIIFYGKKCTHCSSTIHLSCLRNYLKVQTSSECPNCNNPILIDSADETDD